MVTGRMQDGRVELERSDEDRKPLVKRLTLIEGQVRGLRVMIEQDRYCLDELNQISAITAALREVSLMLMGQHVDQALHLAESEDNRVDALNDVRAIVRAAMRARD